MQHTGYASLKPTQTSFTPRKSLDAYSSMGRMLPSQLPSAPQYTISKANKETQKKMFVSEDLAKIDMRGTSYSAAPNSYFPSSLVKEKNGKSTMSILTAKDLEMKYEKAHNAVIGNEPKEWKNTYYPHYANPDDLQLNQADKRRKNKSVNAVLGSEARFVGECPGAKPTPSPFEYQPAIGLAFDNPPKYSFARRVKSQKQLPDGRQVETPSKKRKLNLKATEPGPASYFTEQSQLNKTRSQSVNFLRVPENSHMKSTTAHKFPLSHRSSLIQNRPKNMGETYDIKMRTIMNHYDFENDGGKGQHSGLGWLKGTIEQHAQVPKDKFKMKSYSIGRSQRGQPSRGTFQVHMEFKPAPVRISHPKF